MSQITVQYTNYKAVFFPLLLNIEKVGNNFIFAHDAPLEKS